MNSLYLTITLIYIHHFISETKNVKCLKINLNRKPKNILIKTNLLKILGSTEDESARAGTMINYFVLLSVINNT